MQYKMCNGKIIHFGRGQKSAAYRMKICIFCKFFNKGEWRGELREKKAGFGRLRQIIREKNITFYFKMSP